MGNRILIRAMLLEETGQLVPLSVTVGFRGKSLSNWKLVEARSPPPAGQSKDDSSATQDADSEKKAADDLSAILDTDIKKGALEFEKCPHFPRLLLVLLMYSQAKDAVFSKKHPGGTQLADLLRKGVNPDWYSTLFADFNMDNLFRWPQPEGKGSRKYPGRKGIIEIHEDNFSPALISVRICNEKKEFLSSELATNALTQLVNDNKDGKGNKGKEYTPDIEFAKRLGAKLEIPGTTEEQIILSGKIVWLSQLGLLSRVLGAQLVGETGSLTTLEAILEENIQAIEASKGPILQQGDLGNWTARLDQICQGPFSHELFEAAKYAKLPIKKLRETIKDILTMTQSWPNSADDWKAWLAKTTAAKTSVDDFVSTLSQTTGNCRGYLSDNWTLR